LGTFAWFQNGLTWTDYRVQLTLRSDDDDDIGVMVRYQNPDNYYRFSWDKQRNYRRLVKKENGVFTLLAEEPVPYVTGQTYTIEILVTGDIITVRVDGVALFGGPVMDTGSLLLSGSVALYSWANQGSFFDNVQVGGALVLISPRELDVLTSPDATVDAVAAGFDPSWGVEFVLDGNDAGAIQDFTPPFSHTFVGLTQAEHVVTVFMIDQNLVRQTAFQDQENFGVGDYYVAFGDSITRGITDDLPFDDISADLRNTGGGYEPILNDSLTIDKGYPHTVVNEGVSGEESIDGVVRVNAVLAAHPQSNFFLIQFGTNDAISSMPVPSGLGLHPGDAGYAGSLKGNLQQIYNAVLGAGKTPLFAKIPITYGDPFCSTCPPFTNPFTEPQNLLVQEYNQVIDELVNENGIIVIPPDLYGYFASTPILNGLSEEFADKLHPNGVGFQSMARLWCEAITGGVCP